MVGGHGIDAGIVGLGEIALVEHVIALAVWQRLTEPGIAAHRLARDRVEERPALVRVEIEGQRQDEVGDPLLRDGAAVQEHLPLTHLDRVAGQADHPLDDVVIVRLGRAEHHHIAACRVAPQDTAGQQRQAEGERPARIAIIPLGHEQIVADQQTRQHRFRRDHEGRDDQAAQDEDEQRQLQEKAQRVLRLRRLRRRFR